MPFPEKIQTAKTSANDKTTQGEASNSDTTSLPTDKPATSEATRIPRPVRKKRESRSSRAHNDPRASKEDKNDIIDIKLLFNALSVTNWNS